MEKNLNGFRLKKIKLTKMAELTKYLIVDIDSGKWEWDKNIEHHSIAVPKMLNNLEIRNRKLIKDIAKEIKSGMLENVRKRSSHTNIIQKKIIDTKEELYLHFYMLNDFKRKVLKKVEDEDKNKLSPLLSLKNMSNEGSPLISRKNSPSISHMYERYENTEINEKLEKSQENITTTIETIEKVKECWCDIIGIATAFDSEKLLVEMILIKEKLDFINNKNFEEFEDLYEAFFAFDDATRGILHSNDNNIIKIKLGEILNNFDDYIQRTLIRGINNFSKSEEKENVEKAIEILKKHKIIEYQDINLNATLGVKLLLETAPVKNASLKTCFKKIGEFHSNIHQKMFEIQGLNYLNKYFSEETRDLISQILKQFEYIHEEFIDNSEEIKFKTKNKNIRELEVYRKVLEDLLLETEPGKIYFFLNNKLHNLNAFFISKYFELDEKKLYKILEMMGSEKFQNFIYTCSELMLELRQESKENKEIEKDELIKVGIVTSKTTMIDSYSKAVDEILASLGTFMGNTLHTLIKEMLQNLPYSEQKYRTTLKITYEKIEEVLDEFNKNSYSTESGDLISSDTE
jgi:hypothetical protein